MSSINTDELSTFSDISCLSKIEDNKNISENSKLNKVNTLSNNTKKSANTESVSSTLNSYSKNSSDSLSKNSSDSLSKNSSDSLSKNSSDTNWNSLNSTVISSSKTVFNEFILKEKIPNKIHIDVAVVCEEFNKIELMCEDHVINLDEIDVTMDMFQLMFYPYKENFGLNKDFFINNSKFLPFISFSQDFRTINGNKFYLLEQIISNIESDLCISRHCFTKDSLVELTNEIICIKTLLDIKCCSVLSSLTWSNILDIIKNYKFIHEEIIPVLIVNIVFKTPTQGVKDTVIRFQYKICNNN